MSRRFARKHELARFAMESCSGHPRSQTRSKSHTGYVVRCVQGHGRRVNMVSNAPGQLIGLDRNDFQTSQQTHNVTIGHPNSKWRKTNDLKMQTLKVSTVLPEFIRTLFVLQIAQFDHTSKAKSPHPDSRVISSHFRSS